MLERMQSFQLRRICKNFFSNGMTDLRMLSRLLRVLPDLRWQLMKNFRGVESIALGITRAKGLDTRCQLKKIELTCPRSYGAAAGCSYYLLDISDSIFNCCAFLINEIINLKMDCWTVCCERFSIYLNGQ